MTREEAKEALSVLKIYDNQWLREAIDMAIEALSADAVSREALNGVKFVAIKGDKVEEAYRSGWNGAIECIIENAPSAEAVQGEWIDIDNYYRIATCSHCHKVTMFEKWGEDIKPYDFCPNCGARMKGGAE